MESTGFTGDFAWLVPHNSLAQLLFSRTYIYVKENSTFHVKFVHATENEQVDLPIESVESGTEYDTDKEGTEDKRVSHLGHFILSFDEQRLPELPHLGWRVGRGANKLKLRGVDLLLAMPRLSLGKSLASIHMSFRFHPRSGLLMLRAESPKVPVEYYKNGGEWETLKYEEERVMHQSSTMLRAGKCEYELKYIVGEEHRDAYLRQRAIFFDAAKYNIQRIRFRNIPGDKCVPRGKYLEFESQGAGGFGWVTQGVDTETGEPVAIKEVRIRSLEYAHEVNHEVNLEVNTGRAFVDQRGLLPTVDAFCEHGKPYSCCSLERFYIIMPHAYSDLSIRFWNDESIPRLDKLHWLRELLEGVQALHAMGYMHRDIRLQNMLIMSNKPPRASLCDYGKAVQSNLENNPLIGPKPTLAPEVGTTELTGDYTNKIDMWAYGYAIAEILVFAMSDAIGPAYFHTPHRITPQRHKDITEALRLRSVRNPDDRPLVNLVFKLLVWDPMERWSAEQALWHYCWIPIRQQEAKKDIGKEGTSGSKRKASSEKEESTKAETGGAKGEASPAKEESRGKGKASLKEDIAEGATGGAKGKASPKEDVKGKGKATPKEDIKGKGKASPKEDVKGKGKANPREDIGKRGGTGGAKRRTGRYRF